MNADSLMGHCLARALVTWGAQATPWEAVKLTPRAARVAGFIVLWAKLLDERGLDAISVEDYGRAGYDSLRSSYRHLADFRALFPDEADPNRLACVIRDRVLRTHEAYSPLVAVAL